MEEELAFLSVFIDGPLFVLPSDVPATVEETVAVPFSGSYRKRLLVVVDGTDAQWPQSPLAELLLKILAAAKFSLDDIALVNWKESPQDMPTIVGQMRPSQMLTFGAAPLAQLRCNMYEATHCLGTPALAGDALAGIAADVAKKKKLWDAMKAFFQIG